MRFDLFEDSYRSCTANSRFAFNFDGRKSRL